MINLTKAKRNFRKYIKHYTVDNKDIKLKVKHTYEVMKKSQYIAKKLNLDEENIKLAKLIALLHDIGRFEQIKQTTHFTDNKEFDHANYGVKILFEDNLIENFIKSRKYDHIIARAIYNHNKYKIEENLDSIELLHCKIIRDADKLDNFRVKSTASLKHIFSNRYNSKTINYEKISAKVYKDFLNHKSIDLKDVKTQIDFWLCGIAFIFDLNFEISKQYVINKNYISRLIRRIEYKNPDTKEKMNIIEKTANDYLAIK